ASARPSAPYSPRAHSKPTKDRQPAADRYQSDDLSRAGSGPSPVSLTSLADSSRMACHRSSQPISTISCCSGVRPRSGGSGRSTFMRRGSGTPAVLSLVGRGLWITEAAVGVQVRLAHHVGQIGQRLRVL